MVVVDTCGFDPHIHIHTYKNIYIYRERERERERDSNQVQHCCLVRQTNQKSTTFLTKQPGFSNPTYPSHQTHPPLVQLVFRLAINIRIGTQTFLFHICTVLTKFTPKYTQGEREIIRKTKEKTFSLTLFSLCLSPPYLCYWVFVWGQETKKLWGEEEFS